MDRIELQKLRDLPIEGVAERLGLQVSHHKALCPFHADNHPSLSFKVSKNTFRCFVCGASGGTIDLVMKYLRKDFLEACRWLERAHPLTPPGWEGNGYNQGQNLTTPLPLGEGSGVRPFDVSRYSRFFEHPFLNEEARQFLFEERRLDERVVRWCRLTSWKDRQGVPWLQIPYYDREGKLVGVQNRNLTPSKPPRGEASQHSPSGEMERGLVPRFRFPQGAECGIYNLPVLNLLKPGEQLFITEGCSDCWAMLSAGHKAIAIPSATLLTHKDVELLSNLPSLGALGACDALLAKNGAGVGSFHMYPDNDAPGERLFLQLQKVLPSLVRHQLPMGCKDFSELYRLRKNN
jgi:hypothetical protein